ncbi:hypothetical protein WT34_24410 [Burkholderia stagnalis]|nr:hypothetical protein WT34_24410 [Burkholderia stagnalis]
MTRQHIELYARQLLRDASRDHVSQGDRDGVAKLSHRFGPRTMENETVWEGLHPSGLSNREITDGTIRVDKHVLAARYAVVTGLQRLRWQVQWTTGMSRIDACARLKPVIGIIARYL